ncbi:MAG: Glucosyltransferase-like protein [Thelocarpon impressellum]|nr:MAG: Glucosyltransferase-like protein [Thelocarpon impressellum]
MVPGNTPGTVQPAFALAAFLWPTRAITSQWVVLPLVLMAVGLFRWATALWPYSGFQAPPMHGDFEAQRHWMEITRHLPPTQWYFHDLEWWGLDYPPLTAYHSWALGTIGSWINPTWFALHTSRGLDDPSLKLYMRATVLLSEYLVYVPAAVVFFRRFVRLHGVHAWEGNVALVALLMQPGLILIDHAHFQYNTVMLGFVLASISAFYAERRLWSAVFFVAALGFKQMALYYAPAVFAALLAACFRPRPRPILLLSVALVTGISFATLFAPLLLFGLKDGPALDDEGEIRPLALPIFSSIPLLSTYTTDTMSWYYPAVQQLAQSIHRIFPFARGIFEDKVANLWCALNVVVKLRQFPAALLQRVSLFATLSAILPPCTLIFLRPRGDLYLYGMAATAWGFFLCSFQVHEKSVLLPLLPMTLILAQRGGLTPAIRAWVGWANLMGVWTMYPLLKRDGLRTPYFVLTLLWAYLLGLPPVSLSAYSDVAPGSRGGLSFPTRVLHFSFYHMMVVWHVVEAFVAPPMGKPDLWVVANAGIGAAGFSVCYLWCVWQCLQISGLLNSGGGRRGTAEPARTKKLQ